MKFIFLFCFPLQRRTRRKRSICVRRFLCLFPRDWNPAGRCIFRRNAVAQKINWPAAESHDDGAVHFLRLTKTFVIMCSVRQCAYFSKIRFQLNFQRKLSILFRRESARTRDRELCVFHYSVPYEEILFEPCTRAVIPLQRNGEYFPATNNVCILYFKSTFW